MSEPGGSRGPASPASPARPAASPGGPEGGAARAHHPRSFKLRFAAQREPGRSYVSPVKPLGLPATVTGKFYARASPPPGEPREEETAARRIRAMFERGPRDKHAAPLTSAHEYGWWCGAVARRDPRLAHHVRDSAWMKERLRVLAAGPPR